MISSQTKRLFKRPDLAIIVHDTKRLTFSQPHRRFVREAVKLQPTIWGAVQRVGNLLRPKTDKITVIESVDLYHRAELEGIERCYVLVRGSDFSFRDRLGRDFFDPKATDLGLKFGQIDGPIVEELFQNHFPDLVTVACQK